MVLVAVLSLAVAGGAAAVTRLTGNIDTADMTTALGSDRPEVVLPEDPNAGTPMNIVVMGSDSRDGGNGDLAGGGEMGARSDTTIVMHISGDRSRVEMISIPRDSTVDVPSCSTEAGDTPELYGTKFNAAFSQGVQYGGSVASGALCTVKTIEQLTGVFMNGFIVVDFAGFSSMIDAVGGVEICVEEAIYSEKANHLSLEPGTQTLQGVKALDYARARTGTGLGDGSDLGRIGRQQEVMASLARKVLSQEVLTNPAKTLNFLNAVTDSLTMNDELASIDGLAGLAYSMRSVRPDTITFMTVPNEYDPNNAANVVWTDEAVQLWDNVKHDRPLDSDPDNPSPDPSGSATAADGSMSEGSTNEESTEGDAGTETGAEDGSATEPTPTSTEIKQAGEEAFTGADTTKVCG